MNEIKGNCVPNRVYEAYDIHNATINITKGKSTRCGDFRDIYKCMCLLTK